MRANVSHCSKLEKVLDENVTPQFQYFLFIWALVMSKLAIWLNSVGIQGHKGKKSVKKGQIWSFLANFDLVLPLKFWMPTDFNDLAYFGITVGQMNGKCWNQDVTFSSSTIFHFEQCVLSIFFIPTTYLQFRYAKQHKTLDGKWLRWASKLFRESNRKIH